MSFESGLAGAMVLSLLTAAFFTWRASRSTKSLHKAGQQFARRNLAYVDEFFVPQLDARHAARYRFAAFVMLGSALVAPLTVPRATEDGAAALYPMLIMTVLLDVVLLAHGVAESARPLTLPPGRTLARARTVSVADFVSPGRRAVTVFGHVLALGLLAVLMAARHYDVWSASVAAWWGIVVATSMLLVLGAISHHVARRMVAAPEPADDPATLYWQDALRSESLVGVSRLSVNGIGLICLAVGSGIGRGPTSVTWGVISVALLLLAFAMMMVDPLSLVRQLAKPSRAWFRRRLWPDLVPGEVLTPRSAGVAP